ncbi:MAG: OmpA family protein, partial [Pseudoalteromonas spongiae]
QVFAQNDYRDALKYAYEQIVETKMPDIGISIDNNFEIQSLDFSSLKAPKKDAKGSADHPMIERFPGSYIVHSAVNDFESYPLIIGPYKKSIPTKKVSGKITTINYSIDKNVGPYAVHQNYINALQKAGFNLIYECSAVDCGNYILRDNLQNTIHAKNHRSDIYNITRKSHYYLFSAEKVTPQGKIYATIYNLQYSGKYDVEMVVDIIEERAMSQVALNIDSDTLSKQIQATGSVSLYGIEFDFDKHTLKASSDKQLAEIADFLKNSKQVSLYVVGHTDNKGQYGYNHDLSKRRAAEVVNTLVSNYKIDKQRLTPVGVGPVAPKAANDTESNMQQNRRVELVLKSPQFL